MKLPSIRQRVSRAPMAVLLAALLGWGLLAVLLVGLMVHPAVSATLDSTTQESTVLLYSLVQPLAQGSEGSLRISPPSLPDERFVWDVICLSARHRSRRAGAAAAGH